MTGLSSTGIGWFASYVPFSKDLFPNSSRCLLSTLPDFRGYFITILENFFLVLITVDVPDENFTIQKTKKHSRSKIHVSSSKQGTLFTFHSASAVLISASLCRSYSVVNRDADNLHQGHGCHDESDSGGLLDCKRKEPEVRAQEVQKHFRQQFRFIRASHIYNGE